MQGFSLPEPMTEMNSMYSKTRLKRPLQGEHSAILFTFIKLPFSNKTFVLSIFKWLLKTGFTVFIETRF